MSRRIVALFVLAGAISGTAVAASGAPSKPQLRFARFLGSKLPNNGSMAPVQN